MVAAYPLAGSLASLGDFEARREYGIRGVQVWRSGGIQCPSVEVSAPVVSCLCYEAMGGWHLGEIAACQATGSEAIAVAKELNVGPSATTIRRIPSSCRNRLDASSATKILADRTEKPGAPNTNRLSKRNRAASTFLRTSSI